MKVCKLFCAGVVLVFASASSVHADPEECQEAIHKYNTAIGDVSNAMRVYVGCVNDSHAHDDCSSEFSMLQSAQSDFEDAVSAYGTDCQ